MVTAFIYIIQVDLLDMYNRVSQDTETPKMTIYALQKEGSQYNTREIISAHAYLDVGISVFIIRVKYISNI